MDTEAIENWILENIDKMVEYRELTSAKAQEEEALSELNAKIDEEVAQKASVQIKM